MRGCHVARSPARAPGRSRSPRARFLARSFIRKPPAEDLHEIQKPSGASVKNCRHNHPLSFSLPRETKFAGAAAAPSRRSAPPRTNRRPRRAPPSLTIPPRRNPRAGPPEPRRNRRRSLRRTRGRRHVRPPRVQRIYRAHLRGPDRADAQRSPPLSSAGLRGCAAAVLLMSPLFSMKRKIGTRQSRSTSPALRSPLPLPHLPQQMVSAGAGPLRRPHPPQISITMASSVLLADGRAPSAAAAKFYA